MRCLRKTSRSKRPRFHNIELKQLKAKCFSVDSTSTGSKNAESKNGKDAESKKGVESKQDGKGKSSGDMMIAMLKPGESKTINVTASADEEGELRSCLAIVNCMPAICLTSQVIKPQLELTKVAPKQADRCNVIELEANAESEAKSMAIARVEIVRLPAMQMVVLDDEDPVATKSNVVYSIRVWDEGDANDSNVTLKAEIPEGLEFVSAKGPTEYSIEGSTVSFEAINTMQPGDRADYKVTAKCTGNGDVRFAAMLNSKSLTKVVTGEEPTRLFDQAAK